MRPISKPANGNPRYYGLVFTHVTLGYNKVDPVTGANQWVGSAVPQADLEALKQYARDYGAR